MIDVAAVRADTPGCVDLVHLNNAGASLPPRQVLDAQIGWLELESLTGGYELAAERRAQIDGVYESIGRLLGCDATEIALMANATDAWNAAFAALDFEPGDRILTSATEYASNVINFLKVARSQGVSVETVRSTDTGEVSARHLEAMIDERVKLIAVSHIPTNGGVVNPAEEIGGVARSAGITYLLDACQSVGQLDLDVERLGCDLLTATGRKYLRAPRGTGFLYVRTGWSNEPHLLDLHSAAMAGPDAYEVRPDARRFENWEFGYAAIAGLGAAVDYATALGLREIEQRVRRLGDSLRERLADVSGVTLTDLGADKCGIVTFAANALPAAQIATELRAEQINVSVSRPGSTPNDAERRSLPDLVRASVHYFNTEKELDLFLSKLGALLR